MIPFRDRGAAGRAGRRPRPDLHRHRGEGEVMSESPSAPERDLPPGMQEQLDFVHAGIATFGHRPWLTEPEQLDSWRPDVAIVGAPFDLSTTNRPGARFGPRAIRASAYMPGTYHLDLGIEIFDWLDVFDWMQSQGMRWHLMQEIWERGMQSVIEDAVAEALDGAEHLYVSVDIDVLDPAFAPGTGTPEPGGMAPVDLLRSVRRLALEANLVALDVVEVSPPYDVSDNTTNNAHRVVLGALAGMAWRKQQAAGGQPGLPRTMRGR